MTIAAEVRDSTGILTLDRPNALNALNLEMIRGLRATLDEWAEDPRVQTVVLRGSGEKAFCAGGDVRAMRQSIVDNNLGELAAFFSEEYELDALIAAYPKPLVAIAHGVTMGGGIGLAGHAPLRIATETSKFAMPETRIGFFPDVGGCLLLARAPGRLGEYLALTGTIFTAHDVVTAGFADRIIDSSAADQLVNRIVEGQDPAEALHGLPEPVEAPAAKLTTAREWIDPAFEAPTVAEILHRLDASEVEEARQTAEQLRTLSPTALTITLEAVRRARELDDLRMVLAQDYGLAMWFGATQPDMPEGIRALIVDKDQNPQWAPDSLAAIDPTLIEQAFSYVPR